MGEVGRAAMICLGAVGAMRFVLVKRSRREIVRQLHACAVKSLPVVSVVAFFIGMILARIDLDSLKDKTLLWYSLNRLVIIPLIVYLVCLLLPVSHLARGVSVILAAMPAGASTSILALKYDRDPAFATELVIVSTLLSIPAVMIWSMILK